MANTFLLAMGHDVGASLVEVDMVETANNIIAAAAANDCLILPVDALVAGNLLMRRIALSPSTLSVPMR